MRMAIDEAGQQSKAVQIRHQQARRRYVVRIVDDGEYLTVTDQQMSNAEVFRCENLCVGE